MENEIYQEEKRYFVGILSLTLTWMVIIIIGYMLSFIKNELDVKYITETYNIPLEAFVPERSERMQYIILTALFPLIFVMFYKIIDRIKLIIEKTNSYLHLSALIIFITVFYEINKIEPFYLSETTLQKAPLTFLCCSTIIIGILSFYELCTEDIKKRINKILLFLGGALVFGNAWLYLNRDYYNSTFNAYHFDAYFYPVYKVFSGQTILIDFNCLYGFYAYFLVPILKLIGGVSMYNFSIVMSVLVGIIYLALLASIWKVCINKIIALLGIASMLFFTCLFTIIYHGGNYYLQYLPHRMLFPALFILICTIYIHMDDNKNKEIIKVIGYMISCISLLWNIDTGVVIIITWCLLLIYLKMLKFNFNEKRLYLESLKYIIYAIITIVVSYIILVIITYSRTGELLRLSDVISAQRIFYSSGYAMIRMPLIHQWIILVIIYSIGLSKSLKNIFFIRKSKLEYVKTVEIMYFVLSILGMGLFSYYQGRSHNNVFAFVTWPAFILFVLYIDECLNKIKVYFYNFNQISSEKKINLIAYLVKSTFGILILVCFSISYIYNFKNNPVITTFKDVKSVSEQPVLINTVNFVKSVRKNNEPIDLIMSYSTSVYSILGEKSEVNVPATVDWFTKEDYKKVIGWIAKTKNKIIFDSNSYNKLNTYEHDELNEILNNKFILESNTNEYMVFKPK